MARLSVSEIRELQDRAARAIPAVVEARSAGCWLRYTDSATTWWAGAALMHDDQGTNDLESSIAVAETFYAARGATTRFQVCPACPRHLDDALTARGYGWGDQVSLQVADSSRIARQLPASSLRVDLRVELQDTADRAWVDLMIAAQAPGADPTPEHRMLELVAAPCTYASASISGRPVAVGRAVADEGWAGVFCMATIPDARQEGAARAVLAALAGWAGANDCARMYLQVTHDSVPALRLYQRAGFEEACSYHYRLGSEPRPASSGRRHR
jgi:GNAT superfamily N-acetyltransferase